jgi:hypothetical protein
MANSAKFIRADILDYLTEDVHGVPKMDSGKQGNEIENANLCSVVDSDCEAVSV